MKRILSIIVVLTLCCLPYIAQAEEEINCRITAMEGDQMTVVMGELVMIEDVAESSSDSLGSEGIADDNTEYAAEQVQEYSADVPEDGLGQASSSGIDNSGEMADAPVDIYEFIEGDEYLTYTINNDVEVVLENPDGNTEGTLENLTVGSVVTIITEEGVLKSITVRDLSVVDPDLAEDGDGVGDAIDNGTSVHTISEDGEFSDDTYTSTGDDENALRVDGASVSLSGISIEKSAGLVSNIENGDAYGTNAGLLALNGAEVKIDGSTVTTSAQNGNGVFSYGEGTRVDITSTTINTSGDNSGGIQTAGGAETNADNVTVSTTGNSSAAIRSDRGGGTVTVNGGNYQTGGADSPAIYSTGETNVSNAELYAGASEAVVVEGMSSVNLTDCQLSGNMTETHGDDSNENIHNIMLYQSMSGDADIGMASFTMTGGSIEACSGDMFYVTNTDAEIILSGVDMSLANGKLLTVEGNSAQYGWGNAGENGGNLTMPAIAQQLEGDISVDTISTLNLELQDGSSFNGTINITENDEGGMAVDNNAVVKIGEGCTWELTGDCTISSLDNQGNIVFNGYTIKLADGSIISE